jgi:hypothetical protein
MLPREKRGDIMSNDAKQAIYKALRSYQSDDDASLVGACRDLVTDLVHEMMTNNVILGKMNTHYGTPLRIQSEEDMDQIGQVICDKILTDAFAAFKEEKENAEWRQINRTPKTELPLLLMHKWVFKTSQALYEERLKDIKDE